MENNKTSADLIRDVREEKIKSAIRTQKIISYVPIMGTFVLALLFFGICLLKGYDVSANVGVLLKKAMIVGFLATGATFIFAIGSFDLSLGSNMLVSAAFSAWIYTVTNSILLMLLCCILVSVLLCLINAALASVFNLPVFVMTIAMMAVFGALSTLIINTVSPNGIDTKLNRPSNADNAIYQVIGNVWFQFAILVLFVLACAFMFNMMKMGRRQKFIGGNPVCARLTGINPITLTIFSFIIAGVGIGLAAFFTIMQDVSISSASGSGVGMNMLIAIVFGGMAISGGPRSKATAAFIGGFSMAFLDQFMTLLLLGSGTGSAVTQIVKGVLFLVVVTVLSISGRTKLLQR